MQYQNQPDPNTDPIIKGEWIPGEGIWWQSKCRQALGDTYRQWAIWAVEDAGLTSANAEMNGHGLSIGIMGYKGGKRHDAHFHVNGSVMADIWNWAKAL